MRHDPTFLAQCDACGAQEAGSVGWDYGGMVETLPAGWAHDYGNGLDFCPKCLHCLTGSDCPLTFFDYPITVEKHVRYMTVERLNSEWEKAPRPSFNGLSAWCPKNV